MDYKEIFGELWSDKIAEKLKNYKILPVKDSGEVEINGQEFIPRSRLNEVIEAKKEAQKQLAELKDSIENLKKEVGEKDAVKQKLGELTEKMTQLEREAAEKVKRVKLENAAKFELLKNGALDTDLLIKAIDLEKVSIDGDQVIGLKEQIERLKAEKSWAFGDKKISGADPKVNIKADPDLAGVKNPFAPETYNLTEQARLYRSDPELAEKLKNAVLSKAEK
jgi:chromosome segregation ATPase